MPEAGLKARGTQIACGRRNSEVAYSFLMDYKGDDLVVLYASYLFVCISVHMVTVSNLSPHCYFLYQLQEINNRFVL